LQARLLSPQGIITTATIIIVLPKADSGRPQLHEFAAGVPGPRSTGRGWTEEIPVRSRFGFEPAALNRVSFHLRADGAAEPW
jgi:hypothetical protein